jgi:MFS family permease
MKNLPWQNFLAITISIAVVGLGLGTILPLTALTLHQLGYGTQVIGFMTSMSAIGILAILPLIKNLERKYGNAKSMILAILLASISISLTPLCTSLFFWAATRFFFGMAIGILFTLGEAWLNKIAPNTIRGRAFAIYVTIFTLFQLIGPLLVPLIAPYTDWNFIFCASLFLIALPFLSTTQITHTITPPVPVAYKNIIRQMTLIILGTLFFALFDNLTLSLLPLFGIHHGLSIQQATLSASIILLGNSTLQFPIGWLADRFGRKPIHTLCSLFTVILIPCMPFAIQTPILWWLLLYALGASTGGVYILSLVACGERFQGGHLVTASAIVNATWGITGSIAPLATGVLMQNVHTNTLPIVLWGAAILVFSRLLWENRPRSVLHTR